MFVPFIGFKEREREKMGKIIIMLSLSMALLVFISEVDVKVEAIKTLSEVDRKLKLLNKPAVKSIKVYFSIISS
jgi:hypothetical protein